MSTTAKTFFQEKLNLPLEEPAANNLQGPPAPLPSRVKASCFWSSGRVVEQIVTLRRGNAGT